MNRAQFILSIFILGFIFVACKATAPYILTNSDDYIIPIRAKDFYIDELDFIYLLTNKDELRRYDSELQLQYLYSNDRLGEVASVDINNPFKILVFYEGYQSIVVLDNLLSEIERYNLFDLGINNVSAVGLSNDNQIWIYDPVLYVLKKIDSAGRTIVESITMYNENLEHINPTSLIERANKVFLYDEHTGFIVFDNLGQYMVTIPIKQISSFQILNNNTIIYIKENKFELYDLKYKSITALDLLENETADDIKKIVIKNQDIYSLDTHGLKRKANK